MSSIPCITLWQPWASWIAFGWKTIETRTHARFKDLVGKRVGIHAGLRWDNDAIGLASPWLTLEQQHISSELKNVRGVLVASAYVYAHTKLDANVSRLALIECGNVTRFGLFLDERVILPAPIPMKGAQGIWYANVPRKLSVSFMRRCNQCGCTEERACQGLFGACYWIGPNLCSACGPSKGREQEEGAQDAGQHVPRA